MDISELYDLFTQHPFVTTDSRDCPLGSIFFALRGTTFNGNRFARAALEKGCAYAVVDEPEFVDEDDMRFVLVNDCLQTLQQLANRHRRTLGTRIIGITGTNGKTTTKELVSAILAERYNVLYTQGNFNNEIGVPKTLLRLTPEHQIAVIEMGASHPGDIKTLVEIVEPDFALITNVGRAHLQGFGSFEGVMKTKGELYDFMATRPNAPVFINADNEYLMRMANERSLPIRIGYGQTERQDVSIRGEVLDSTPFLKFRWCHSASGNTWNEVQSQLIGTYNLDNMLAAITIGTYFDVTDPEIDHALENYTPSNNRSQLKITEHNKLIVDAYNANPTSMNAALLNFRDMKVEPKMAILGDMRELGDVSTEEHQKIVDLLPSLGIKTVWLVGEEFYKTRTDYPKFKHIEEVEAKLEAYRPENYYILMKGSNGIKLFQLTELL